MSSCSISKYSNGDHYLGLEFAKSLNAKIVSDTTSFDKNNVTFDMYIGLYNVNRSINYRDDLPEIYTLAIYVSNSKKLPFKLREGNYIDNIENVDGAKLIRNITYQEAFNTDFGYTVNYLSIHYSHKEKIIIPAEFFNSKNNTVYIHTIELLCYEDVDVDEKHKNEMIIWVSKYTSIEIEYSLNGNIVTVK